MCIKKRNIVPLVLLISMLLSSFAYSQITTKQANELKKSLSSNMITLLFDEASNSKSTKIFLLKLEIGEKASFKTIEVSDNLDSLFKQSYLATVDRVSLSEKIKNMKLKPQLLIVPIHYIFGKMTIDNVNDINRNKLSTFTLFNKKAIEGKCVWLEPIVTNRN